MTGSHRFAALILLAAALLGGALLTVLGSGDAGGPLPAAAAREEQEELAELTSPADALLARTLVGSEVDATIAYRRARTQAKASRRTTARRAPAVAAAAWRFEGPENIGGRVLDIAVDPEQPDTLYIATATGGVWKSTDAGKTFTSSWPDDETQAISSIVMTPSGILYAATGESGPGGGSMSYGGAGVFKSTDRGRTWRNVGLENTSRISRIVVDPTDEDRLYVAASGNLFKAGGDRGLYRSENAGRTWQLLLAGANGTTGATDVAIDPKNPNRIFAAMWDHRREPDKRTYEGVGSGLLFSADGGKTWSRTGGPSLAAGTHDLGRIGVAIAPSNPNTVYAMVSGASGAARGFYRSTDGGSTWAGPILNADYAHAAFVYGWWFGRLWVDPKDPQHVFVAGVPLVESKDGGITTRSIGGVVSTTPNAPHADQHAMAWDPKVPNRVYLGNDGGLYRSDDNGVRWTFGAVQPFSQLYSLDVNEDDPGMRVAGLQDNGVNITTPDDEGRWRSYGGGDGERTLINPKNPSIVYGCSQYGACFVNKRGGASGNNQSFEHEVVSTRKNWFMPIEFDPENPSTIYAGGEIMSRSDNDGGDWKVISPDLTNGPGRETNPLFRNFGTLTTIAPTANGVGTIYAGTDDGNLWYTHNGGGAWTKASDPDLPKAWITRVEVDHSKPTTAYVTYSGFRTGDDAPSIYRTTDGGQSWEPIAGDLPRAPLNDVNVIGDVLVVASDVGVYASDDGGRRWLRVGRGLPLAPVHELRWHAPTERLYVATFGRGMYSVELPGRLAQAARR